MAKTGSASPGMVLFDFPSGDDQPRSEHGGRSDPTVAVVGLGYVGLPTALALRARGVRVIGLEISQARIGAIQSMTVDLVDADRRRLEEALAGDDLTLTSDPQALADADAVIVCVPTPVDEHRAPDLGPLRAAVATVVARAVPGQLIVLTSTSYVGCTRDLVAAPLEARGFTVGSDVFVAYSPERIDPGNTRHPQETVPRVLGGVTPACTARAEAVIGLVAPVYRVSSPEAAELTKLYENTFRAVNIALVNELEGISQVLELDVSEVIDAASSKPFGFMPFRPGTGVGGHCIPCDPHYLLWQLRAHRQAAPLIEQAMAGIAARPLDIVDRAVTLLSEAGLGIRRARVLVVGVAYKPGVADARESPAVEIIEALIGRGADVEYLDPLVPSLRLADGRVLESVAGTPSGTHDLVLIHALQPGVDATPYLDNGLVLDPGDALRRAPTARPTRAQPPVVEAESVVDDVAVDRRNGSGDDAIYEPTAARSR